jgi:carboxyl-terminal processing protease
MIFRLPRRGETLFHDTDCTKGGSMARAKLTPSFRLWAICVGTLVVTTICVRQLSSAEEIDHDTTQLVAQMVPRFHLNGGEINDDVGVKTLDGFIDRLDGSKLYFLKGDVAQFQEHATQIDDELNEGQVEFAYEIFDTYKARIARQIEVAHKLIDAEHDFTLNETMIIKADELEWCETVEELDDRWRKLIKYELALALLDEEDPAETRERLHRRYRNLTRRINEMNQTDVLEAYLTAMTMSFDPHSTYMSPNSWENFKIQLDSHLQGIGAQLRSDDGYTIVDAIVPGGAADKDGRLKVGDTILGVGQEEGEIQDIYEWRLDDVVGQIRGAVGTVVRLRVRPETGGDPQIIDITREVIELTEQQVKGEIIETIDRVGREGRVGIIRVPSFYRDFEAAQSGGGSFASATRDVQRVLESFEQQGGVDAVVVDLRDNGGGALTEAVELSGLFIDRGPVVQVRLPNGSVQSLDDEVPGAAFTRPVVVVCNRLSASASEIFAGVIKDYHRGIVVGDTTTHGKGTVQNLLDVVPQQLFQIFEQDELGKLKLTIQQFYRVNGDSTQNRGVPSDVVLPSEIDHFDLGESFLDNALPFHHIAPARFSPGAFVSEQIVAQLQQLSETRVSENEEFQEVEEAIVNGVARRSRSEVSLNLETLRAEREEDEQAHLDAEEREADGQPEEPDPNAPVFAQDYYNDEILNITLDYLELLEIEATAQN